uniref:Vacuolar protein sorting-associated protein 13C n=2 Tax=Cacopsylla melanoneura TaxID=428564 RepID=A0A8D8LZY6_9HEMI
MVFESLVADLLNRYIGEYVQNLDKNQLKIGIWGGDVVLKNLILKQSALDELNLPIRTIYGRLGQLTLKIPWKNLYGAPVEASVDTLYLIAVPNQEIKYDPVKEEQWAQDAKQKEIDKVELAKQQEKEKEEGKEKAQDTFVEKLATQIIRNVQVFIKKIHIRYEDRITNPKQPFAAGITLFNLTVHTTDEKWSHYISSGQDTSSMIYKMLNLEAASVYWNSDTKLFSEKETSDMEELFLKGIADKARLAPHYEYILGPINAVSRLRINTKPETDFSIPKITFELDLERLQVRLSKEQYKDVIRLVDSLNHMSKASLYRKYRPALDVHQGFAKEWWHFAYRCILEEHVRRRRRNWQWSHMKEHRNQVHTYERAWRAKLTTAKPTAITLAQVEACERYLDAMNIIVVRQKVENAVARETHMKNEMKANENKGWLGGWLGGWGGGGANQAAENKNELVSQFEEAMTPKEKEKLYKAIGYQESALPAAVFPDTFIEVKASFVMHCLEIEIRDEALSTPRVLIVVLKQMKANLEKRPVSSALKIASSVEVLSVFGLAQDGKVPQLVTSKRSKEDGEGTLLNVLFEINPLCRTCDQRIHVTAKPLQVVYDAHTLIQVSSIFTPDKSEADVMYQLQEAAASKMIEIKEMSALGLQNAITKRTVLDLNIRLEGSYLLIPHGGHYTGVESLLVVNLGSIGLTSIKACKTKEGEVNVAQMHRAGTSDTEIINALIEKSYDQFCVELNDLQAMITYPGERWLPPVEKDIYILRPMNVSVTMHKCLIMDDPRLPRVKVLGELPKINIKMAETRLLRAFEILLSIPQKTIEAPPMDPVQELMYSSTVSLKKVEMRRKRNIAKKQATKTEEEDLMQFTDLELKFLLKEFNVSLEAQRDQPAASPPSPSTPGTELSPSPPPLVPLLDFKMADLEVQMTQKTFDLIAFVRLGGLSLVQNYKTDEIQVISTPREEALLTIQYNQINRKSPDFRTKYESCLQILDVNFSKMAGVMHQEALLDMWKWSTDIMLVIQKMNEKKYAETENTPGKQLLGVPGSRPSSAGKSSLSAEKMLRKTSVMQAFASRGASAASAPIIEEDETEGNKKPQDKRKTFKKIATASKLLSGVKADARETKREAEEKKKAAAAKEVTDLRISLNMGDLNFALHSERGPLATFDIDGIHLSILLKRSVTKLKVTLDNLAMFSSLPDSLYSQILSVPENLEALKADITLYNGDDGLTEVIASIAQCRLVFLNRFTSQLLQFVNQFQAGKQAIIEASQAAVATAKQNLQDMYAAASKVSLEISIAAPVLVIPACSGSTDAIIMDFGNLTVRNKFEVLETKNVKGHPAVLDHCCIELVNMTMSRVRYAPDTVSLLENIVLIRPINFSLTVVRNLCAGWYKDKPDLNVSGSFKTINLSLSREDYATLMRISSGNLAEGGSVGEGAPTPAPLQPAGAVTLDEASPAAGTTTTSSPASPPTLASPTSPDDPNRQTMVFAFSMDSLVCELRSQAAFTLSSLNIEGAMYADSSMRTRVVLADCLLDDTRVLKKAKKVSRYMEKKQTSAVSDDPNHHMIEVTVYQKGGILNTDMIIRSFNLILNLDFILKTLDFVTVPPEAIKPSPGNLQGTLKVTPITSRPSSANEAAAIQAVAAPTQESLMTLNLTLEKPDLILVENLDNLDTNAIIMNTEMKCTVKLQGQRQVIDGTIKDLQIYSCIYNPLKRDETMSQILRPVTISLAGSTPEGKGLHLEVVATPLLMSVSPATIEMLNRINATIFTTQEQEEAALEPVNYSQLWDQKRFAETDYWFLKTERAVEALEELFGGDVKEEVCIISMPRIVITVEAGLPMILTQLSFQAKARNWSSKLALDSVCTLQVRYYNVARALWEPLIEPVEQNAYSIGTHAPWEVEMSVETNDNRHVDTEEEFKTARPGKVIRITSKQNMEITITKTCLNVLTDLGKAFNEAINVKASGKSKHELLNPPQFIIENYLGIPIVIDVTTLNCTAAAAAVATTPASDVVAETSDNKVSLGHLETVELRMNSPEDAKEMVLALESDELVEQYMKLEIPGRNQVHLDIPVSKADRRFYPLDKNGTGWSLVCDITIQDATSIVRLRSNLQVFNELGQDIHVYTRSNPTDTQFHNVLSIPSDSSASLPLPSITSSLYFSTTNSHISSSEFKWTQLQNAPTIHELIRCEPKSIEDSDPTFMNVDGKLEQIYFENSNKFTMVSNNYRITVRPTVIIKNNLPLPITLLMQGVFHSVDLDSGHSVTLVNAEPGTSSVVVRIDEYLEKKWICKVFLEEELSEFNIWKFESFDSAEPMALNLGMHVTWSHSTILMDLYCPFWMINKTDLMLSYKPLDDSNHVLYHPPSYKGTIMFSYREKAFFGKKKACIKVENGDWSDKFSLDVVGSSGCIDCTYRGKVYHVGVHINLTSNSLTKMVLFTPYYVIINNCSFDLEFAAEDKDTLDNTDLKSVLVTSNGCTSYWPPTQGPGKDKKVDPDKKMRVRVVGETKSSPPFPYSTEFNDLLKLRNKYGAINVEVHVTESSSYVTFSEYRDGMSPLLIINHTSEDIDVHERYNEDEREVVKAGHKVYWAWSLGAGLTGEVDRHNLVWMKRKVMADVRKDGLGKFFLDDDLKRECYWTCFLDGIQRVLLFTEDEDLVMDVRASGNYELFDQEITLSMHRIGVSLVDNYKGFELLYLSITSSGIIWESQKSERKRFKQLNIVDSNDLENAFIMYNNQLALKQNVPSTVKVSPEIEADFESFEMTRPSRRRLRRVYNSGLWVQMRSSSVTSQFHMKLNRLQVDNQMQDAIYPVVMAPVPLPKTIAANHVLKPFIEVSIVQRLNVNSQVRQYKYYKVLIQEFHVKVELSIVNALTEFFASQQTSKEAMLVAFEQDIAKIGTPLLDHVSLHTAAEVKNYYDELHFSPLKIHVSFTAQGSDTSALPEFLSILMQSIGVTLTDIHDVVFKLSYFERNGVFLNQSMLVSEVTSHYTGQFLKQAYVLVLGLDVLGNPYGLVTGLATGVEDLFYEPFQGAIQGPGEFAEGLMIGARSFIGHTVGGAAGAASRITGAMGKGIAALTFDKEYQRRRRLQNTRQATLHEDLAASGKGLVLGFVQGVSGVVTKPIEGAKDDGVGGFVKGFGKGMIGLVTRPTAGIVDFASGSLNAVRRVADNTEETKRSRAPRLMSSDGITKPYAAMEAEGNAILHELDKGKYIHTDVYVHHIRIASKDTLLITSRRLLYLTPNDLFGGLQVDWEHPWTDFAGPPQSKPEGVLIKIKTKKKTGLGGLFGSSGTDKLLLVRNEENRSIVIRKMKECMDID